MKDAINRLLRWIKGLLRYDRKPAKTSPRIQKEWRSAWGVLYLLVRNTEEAVDASTYRFYTGGYCKGVSLLLTCDRYKPIRGRNGSDRSPSLQGLRNGAPSHGHPIPSHRLSLTRITETTNFTAVETEILWSYPVDFVGVKTFDHPDRFAKIITAKLAFLLLSKEYEQIDWEYQIDALAKEWVGSNHEILSRGKVRGR